MKTVVINGQSFSDLEGFYDEVEQKLTKHLEYKTGRNMDAFNDILYGGFGVIEPDEAYALIWHESANSRLVSSSAKAIHT